VKIGIVGAGGTGLTAGFELTGRGHTVTVFERESQVGGLTQTVRVGNELLEKAYHHLFTSDTDFIELAEELGLGSKLLWIAPKNGIYLNHRLHPFTSPKDLLRLNELSIVERLAMGYLMLKAKTIRDWRPLERIPARDWVIKTAGQGVWNKFWRPLLAAKFDQDADRVSAVWLWSKIKLRGSTRGKNPSRELLGYMQGSFGLVNDALVKKITDAGGKVLCNHEVKRITPRDDQNLDVDGERFDAVLVTCAPQLLLEMVPSLPEEFREKIGRIKYKANICLTLELRHQVSPYYWTSIAQNDFPFVAMIEHTNLLPKDPYNAHILYLSRYIDEKNELFQKSDAEIQAIFIAALKKIFPQFDESDIINARMNRERFAQPVIVTEYSRIVPDFRVPVANLYLACMAQIYPEDRGQNYAVRIAKQVVDVMHNRK